MARIAYADEKQDEEVARISQQIRTERGRMHNLYLMLLNSPPIARGWLNLLTAVRQRGKLPGRYRELAILRIAVLNGAQYEYEGHVPFALKEGLSKEAIENIASWQVSNLYSEPERAVLAYTDCMTKEIGIPDKIFEAIASVFEKREIVELTTTVAAYNMVSRFLVALQIDSDE